MNRKYYNKIILFASGDHIYLSDIKPIYNCVQPKVLGLFLLKNSILVFNDALTDEYSDENDENKEKQNKHTKTLITNVGIDITATFILRILERCVGLFVSNRILDKLTKSIFKLI